jgi:tRNA dimethylallyltransferase
MNDRSATAILIAGPTASGKSALALALAEHLGGVIVNADSMQVYDELRILTARPSAEEELRVPHRLYGHIPAREAYSAGRFHREAGAAIAEARAAGRPAIFVGGTGLYFKVLLEGLSPIPDIPEVVRSHWRAEGARRGAADLHGELAQRDPAMAARLMPTDTQRLVRALEVLEGSGKSLAEWQAIPGTPLLAEADTVRLVVSLDRDELYRRCDARFDSMLRSGALEEVQRLRGMQLDPALPAMRALGVGPLMALLEGRMGHDEAATRAKSATRNFAKRQLTWLRRHMIAWEPIHAQQTQFMMQQTIALIRRGG